MKIFRDPITHFILIGLALVAINYFWADYQGEQGRTIIVSAPEMKRLEKIWANTAGKLPTGEDRQMIIDQYVQEEVLVREAARMGLDVDDVIIRRRLAQKMDFLLSDESKAENPSDAELEIWFQENRDQFAAPESRSFNHIYLSPENRGNSIESDALALLDKLESGADWKKLGDPFIQKRSYAAVPQEEVTRLFGSDFAKAIFDLKPRTWSQPIGSAFGLHLVRIETIDKAAEANLAPIKAEVLAAWHEDQTQKAKQAALRDLVAGYSVIIENDAQ